MDSQNKELIRIASRRIWASWLWYVLFPGLGPLFSWLHSGEKTGFVMALALSFVLVPNSKVNLGQFAMPTATLLGGVAQHAAIMNKRKRVGVTSPEEADALLEQA